MKQWNRYTNLITANCKGVTQHPKDVAYWRNNLFAGTIIYLLPFCLIALVPGLYLSIVTGLYVLAVADVLTLVGMLVIAFVPGIPVTSRKIVFISCLYILGCVLLYYIGLAGPGLLYLQATCVFGVLISAERFAWWPPVINLAICILFIVPVSMGMLPWAAQDPHPTATWIAVSSNLVFLSFLTAGLVPRLFRGLQFTIENEKQLHEQVIAEQVTLEAAINQLEQKNKELEQFAYVASHDLQEPLRMITSFLTRLEKQYNEQLDERGKQYIYFAVDGARRMNQIIVDLLEYSRVGKTSDKLEEVDLNKVMSEILSLYHQQVLESNARVVIDELPMIRTYRTPMRQVFQNLVSNALKYRSKSADRLPEITVSFKDQQGHWLFSVTDNGIGIKPLNFDRIFLIFQRLHNKEEYPGTGIGLAIIKKIVQNMGGEIWVVSGEGTGSTFYFTIPKV